MAAAETTSLSSTPSSPGRASSSTTTTPAAPRTRSRPSFPIAYSRPPPSISSSSIKGASSTTPAKPATSSTTPSTPTPSRPPPPADSSSHPRTKHFVVPAHPQSHHLHSLPPREKTTRTLILDHTAWQHTRTRFAQGRCELGMHVRFKRKGQAKREVGEGGGSGARNAFYISSGRAGGANAFGNPPEVELASSEDEGEDDEGRDSDGEGVDALSYGARRDPKGVDQAMNMNDVMDVDRDITSASDEAASNDATHAPELAARAIGIEKVLHAMLAQPPSPPPRSPSPPPYALHSSHAHSQHYRAPPSASTNPLTATTRSPHTLPNGVRLRLALLALVNDLFQRQPLPASEIPPTSSTKPQTTGSSMNTGTFETAKAPAVSSPPGSPTQLPPPSLPSPNVLPPALTALVQVSSQPFFGPPSLPPSFHTLPLPASSAGGSSAPVLSPISGTGIQTSSPSFGAQKKTTAEGTQPARPPPPLFSWTRPGGSSAPPPSPGPLVSDSATSPVSPSFPRAPGPLTATSRALPTSWKGSAPRYHHSGSRATGSSSFELHRRTTGRARELYAAGCHAAPGGSRGSYRSDATTYGGVPPPIAPGYPVQKLKMLCPRHLLETCAVCTSGGKDVQASRIGAGLLRKTSCCGGGSGVLMDMMPMFLRLSALVAMELGREARGEEAEVDEGASAVSTAPSSSAARPAQPTRAWYALLCGLLTRSVIEGYVARGWKGVEYAEVLMSVGLGVKARKGSGTSTDAPAMVEEVAGEFEPDEMPGIMDASKVLFAVEAEDATEYSAQMEGRMSEFLSIPNATPDLATHLMALSTQYPAAPVERAALRFCEAVAQWRGRPELETYKAAARASSPGTLPIHALLASPAPRRPHIERYFRIAPPSVTIGLRKRANTTEGEERAPKREKVDLDLGESLGDEDADSEWVGPYGV